MIEGMSRAERLECWAAALERSPTPTLTPFRDVEFLPSARRARLQAANSPLAIAFAEPVLRRAGLQSDRFGDGAEFFGLTRYQAHRVLCTCGYIARMRAREVARRVRKIAARERLRELWPHSPLPAFVRWLFAPWRPMAGQRG